jgi:hypothetical protein
MNEMYIAGMLTGWMALAYVEFGGSLLRFAIIMTLVMFVRFAINYWRKKP